MKKILLKNGLLVDGLGREEKQDLLIEEGKIVKISSRLSPEGAKVLDCQGKVIFPGLIDLHLHFREPGVKRVENIAEGIERAIRGGFTGCLMMPNTSPPIDSPELVKFVKEKAFVFPDFDFEVAAAITQEQKGEKIVEMGLLKEAGVKVLTDDGSYVQSSWAMKMALRYSSAFDLTLMQHPEDLTLSLNGQINEGIVSAQLGLEGIPASSEEVAILRDLNLLKYYPAKVHFTHISTAGSVEILKQAKEEGLKVTFDVTPHHLLLTEERLVNFDPAFKMKPPLRTKKDVEALEKALQEKIVDVIATDHAPHPPEEKEVEFERASFGVVGLDTALSLIYQNFVLSGKLTYTDLAFLMSLKPAEILGLKRSLELGATAYLTVFDPDFEWVYQKKEDGLCYNSPFLGEKMKGKAFGVISGGKLLFWEGKLLG